MGSGRFKVVLMQIDYKLYRCMSSCGLPFSYSVKAARIPIEYPSAIIRRFFLVHPILGDELGKGLG
jgi:hypothetical protein